MILLGFGLFCIFPPQVPSSTINGHKLVYYIYRVKESVRLKREVKRARGRRGLVFLPLSESNAIFLDVHGHHHVVKENVSPAKSSS